MNALVVVADAFRARIFRTKKGLKNLVEIEDAIHSESRFRNKELNTDSAGRGRDQHSTLDPRTTPKEHEEHSFARQLGKHIKQLFHQDRFEELILVASPRFLGKLRESLPAPVSQLESRSVDKELIHLSPSELVEHIWNS